MSSTRPVTTKRIFRLWWPLAASWILMGGEVPLVTAFIARRADAESHLAALGALVYPLSLLVEAPIIMLLAASTALSKDRPSYDKLLRFTHAAGFALTLAHVAVAFTPLYDFVATELVHAPDSAIEPGRIGLMIMTPWTWAIAYRRFQQGVLIRFERSNAVIAGTMVRLGSELAVLFVGFALTSASGIVLATSAIAAGVVAEAVFAGVRVQPILRDQLSPSRPHGEPLTRRAFLRFYLPLAVTPLMTLIIQPVGAAAMNRMPHPLSSVAAWPAVYGLVFLTRSAGFALNEVAVALIGAPNGVRQLRRFAVGLAATTVGLLAVVALTPIGELWFGNVMGLPADLVTVAVGAVAFALLMPAYAVMQSFYQGALVHARNTRGVTEAVTLYLVVSIAALGAGVWLGSVRGIVFALCSFTFAGVLQTLWLRRRALPLLR